MAARARINGPLGRCRATFGGITAGYDGRTGSWLVNENSLLAQTQKGDLMARSIMETPGIDEIDKFVARLKDRQIDWGVLDFQARVNPKLLEVSLNTAE